MKWRRNGWAGIAVLLAAAALATLAAGCGGVPSPAAASDSTATTTPTDSTSTPTPNPSGGATGAIDTPTPVATTAPDSDPPALPTPPSRTHVTFCSGSNLKPSRIIAVRPEQDCGFLLAIRSSLRGDATTGLEAWTDATRFDRWPEVTVNGSFRVTGIAITTDHGLSGTLSPYLSRLDHLTSLTIANNDLTGEVIGHLGLISGLTRLDLGDNALTGEIPGQLGHLDRLEHLDLGGNAISGAVPGVLGSLTNLTHLDLSGNALTGAFPRELARLTSLETLKLGGGNAFTGCIPPSLRRVASNDLASLNLPDCHPCETQGAVSDAGSNPGLVRDCVALLTAKAALSDRRAALLDWSADRAITTWTGVTVTGTPPRVTALTLARTGGRESGGRISPALGNLDALTSLTLSWNKLRGPIPPELGNLSKLETLLLNRNALTGEIPAELGNLAELRVLSLTSNSLTGAIPPALGNLSKLEDIALGENRFTGCVPSALLLVSRSDAGDLGLKRCGDLPSRTLTYDTYDTTGKAMEDGSYSFLRENDDGTTTPISAYEDLRGVTTPSHLFINKNDASGVSRANILDAVVVGDQFNLAEADDCFTQFVVTEVKDDPAGDVPRKALVVQWTIYGFTGCGASITDDDVSIIWGQQPSLGGNNLTVPVMVGIHQLVPDNWTGTVRDVSHEAAPGGSHLIQQANPSTTVLSALDYWREPEIPEGWGLVYVSAGTSSDPYQGFSAIYSPTEGGGTSLEFQGYFLSHRNWQVPSGSASSGVVVETRVIAGRPALIEYSPPGDSNDAYLPTTISIIDLATESGYTLTAYDSTLKNIDTLIAIARSLFEETGSK